MKTRDENAETRRQPAPGATSKRRRWGIKITLSAVSLIFALLLAEAAIRLLKLAPPNYAPRRFEPTGGVPFAVLDARSALLVYRPSTTFASVYDPAGDARGYLGPEGRVDYRINQVGLRGPDLPAQKPPGTFTVLCLGDSFTFGEGVREEDTYPARLAKLLTDAGRYGRVEVINAGVQGYGTREATTFYARQGFRFQPDVVVLGFVLNDATDFAETIRQNDARNKEAPLSPAARVSKLWEMIERRRQTQAAQAEFFETTRRSFEGPGWQECQRLLTEMNRRIQHDGARLVVAVFPIFIGLEGEYPFTDLHTQVAAACREAGGECIDLLEVYRGRPSASLWVHPTDQHPNELAHRLAAERIAAQLVSGGTPLPSSQASEPARPAGG